MVIIDTSDNASLVPPDTEGHITRQRVDDGNVPVLLSGNVEGDTAHDVTMFVVAVRNIGAVHSGGDVSLSGEEVRNVGSVVGGDGNQEGVGRNGFNWEGQY